MTKTSRVTGFFSTSKKKKSREKIIQREGGTEGCREGTELIQKCGSQRVGER